MTSITGSWSIGGGGHWNVCVLGSLGVLVPNARSNSSSLTRPGSEASIWFFSLLAFLLSSDWRHTCACARLSCHWNSCRPSAHVRRRTLLFQNQRELSGEVVSSLFFAKVRFNSSNLFSLLIAHHAASPIDSFDRIRFIHSFVCFSFLLTFFLSLSALTCFGQVRSLFFCSSPALLLLFSSLPQTKRLDKHRPSAFSRAHTHTVCFLSAPPHSFHCPYLKGGGVFHKLWLFDNNHFMVTRNHFHRNASKFNSIDSSVWFPDWKVFHFSRLD